MNGLPVVIRADLIAEGDQSGCTNLMYAAAPATCGQDIDVPDKTAYLTDLLSAAYSVTEANGEYAARISTPGAVTSG